MSLGAPIGLLAAALAGPLVLWYVLRSRRPRRVVASTFLWRTTDRSPSAAVPWQRFRGDVTFWLVLLALLAGALALAQPFLRVQASLGDHTILVMDVSGSMLADEQGPTRLELARREALDLVGARNPGQEISVIEAGARARVLLSASSDQGAIERALLAVRPTHGPADLRDAFTLASSLERPGQQTVVHLLTDGNVPDTVADVAPDGLLVTAVGSDRPNVGVTRLQAVPVGAGSNQVFVQVQNHHALPTTADVVVSVDGDDVVSQSVRLPPRGTEDLLLTVPGGGGAVLAARVEPAGSDALGIDDRAWTVLTSPRDVTVLTVGDTNVFLEAALGAMPGVTVEHADTLPADVTADIVVIERVAAPDALPAPTLLIDVTDWPAGVTAGEPVTTPAITFQAAHDLLTDVDLSGLAMATATPIEAAALTPLASGPDGTWIAAGRLDRSPVVAIGFDLTESNLPLQPAWPILLANTVNWLVGPPSVVPATAGQVVTLTAPDAVSLSVSPPGGQPLVLDAAAASLTVDQVGLWRVTAQDADGAPIEDSEDVLAVNADPSEGDLSRPRQDLVGSGARQDEPGTVTAAEGRRPLHEPLLVAALVLALAEAGWWWGVRPLLRRRRTGARPAVLGTRQQQVAAGARGVAVVLLVFAILDWRLPTGSDRVDVAFVLDVSDSVGVEASTGIRWIDDALGHMGDGDRAAIAGVGRSARLEHSLRNDPIGGPLTIVVDGSATDLATGLRLGQGVVGSDHRRRVVLLTDGFQNRGDAVDAARQLADAGVRVDVVGLLRGQAADVLVEEVRAPGAVREGDAYDVAVDIRNTGASASDVVLRLLRDSETVDERTVTAEPGITTVTFREQAPATGTFRYEARLSSGASAIPQNDVGRTAVRVGDAASVLVVEGRPGEGADLADALDAAGIQAQVIDAAGGLPPLDQLLAHQAVLLANVPAAAVGDAGMQALDAFVRDAGRGLVAIGGDDSFGMGDYDGTVLEDLLPVFARVKDPKKRPSVAEALVVDVSGSMAACHCRNDGFGGEMIEEGGVNKTDITKEAVARAVRALEDQDVVGVLAFNAQQEWVVPLQQLPDLDTVDAALARLHPDGPTDVVEAVREAIAGLKTAEARLRHIVLFTDGFSEDPRMVEAAREASEAGITLSVVATGEGTGEVLRDMAEAGGGRYYPGRDLLSIPDIIVSEVQFAARPIINEGVFTPTITSIDPVTDGLTSSPPLLGYLSTTDKPTANTLLRIGEESDPLLARWQVGLGTSLAWTSDASARWSQHWADWEGYVDFWSRTVKSTFPAPDDPAVTLEAVMTSTGMRITARSAEDVPTDAELTVTITDPDGTRTEVTLPRTGLAEFSAEVPTSLEGVYAIGGALTVGGTPSWQGSTTAIRSWSPEYAPTHDANDILARIAEAGGGLVDADPASAFDPEGLAAGTASRSLWPLLAAIALVLLVADIGLRRLRLERGDLGRALAAVRARRPNQRDSQPPAPTETTTGLLAARDRARRKLESDDD